MKKIYTIIFALAILTSCSESNIESETTGVVLHDSYPELHKFDYRGCEYIYMIDVHKFGITHLGNCNNPTHPYNELIKD